MTAHRDIAAPFDKLRSTRATAASQAYSAIRNDIIYGRLPPGQKLKIDALCKRHEVTLNPIREALNRLSAEGLVVQEDQKGFSVAPISIELWRELVQSRCMLEVCALQDAIANRNDAWEEGVVLTLHWLLRTPSVLDGERNPAWDQRHNAFHAALLASCRSRTILGFCADLRERSDRYRFIAAMHAPRRDTAEEHRGIADAALSGQSQQASDLLVAHYRRTLGLVEGYFAAG